MSDLSRAISLPGFHVEALLGSGGFADVFRYQQNLPKRLVAIKILRSEVGDPLARTLFEQEANLMASLSSHPAIVTIYQVGIADDNRPFLVMEYCSKPNLEQRYLSGPLPLAEVLQYSIRLSGAVETAHRAGILHLDIKPANVLTTDFGWPALTDFGISQLLEHGETPELGLSLPWASPEALRGQPLTQASDVYSLAATVYTLLAGREPFGSSQQGHNRLINRIITEDIPAIERSDVPEDLHQLFQRALYKNPAERLASALEFGRALQSLEQQLGLPNTPIDVPDDLLEDLERTRASFRGVNVISDEDQDDTVLSPRKSGVTTEADDDTVLSSRSTPTEPDDSTIQVKRKRKKAQISEDRTERSHRKSAHSEPISEVNTVASPEPSAPSTDPRIVIPRPAEEKIPEGYRIREFTPKSSLRVAPGPLLTPVTIPADVQAIEQQRKLYRSRRNRALAALVTALLISGALVVAGVLLITDLLS